MFTCKSKKNQSKIEGNLLLVTKESLGEHFQAYFLSSNSGCINKILLMSINLTHARVIQQQQLRIDQLQMEIDALYPGVQIGDGIGDFNGLLKIGNREHRNSPWDLVTKCHALQTSFYQQQ